MKIAETWGIQTQRTKTRDVLVVIAAIAALSIFGWGVARPHAQVTTKPAGKRIVLTEAQTKLVNDIEAQVKSLAAQEQTVFQTVAVTGGLTGQWHIVMNGQQPALDKGNFVLEEGQVEAPK